MGETTTITSGAFTLHVIVAFGSPVGVQVRFVVFPFATFASAPASTPALPRGLGGLRCSSGPFLQVGDLLLGIGELLRNAAKLGLVSCKCSTLFSFILAKLRAGVLAGRGLTPALASRGLARFTPKG